MQSFFHQLVFRIAAATLIAGLLLVSQSLAAQPKGKSNLDGFQKAYRERQLDFRTDLEKLALSCEEKGLSEAAASLRSLKISPDWTSLHLEALPPSVLPNIPVNLPEDERAWRVRLRALQTEYAEQLYVLARRVLQAGYPGFAYNLVRETAINDPDHKMARRLLGYVRHKDDWVTPFAAEMLKKQHEWTDEFGWIKSADIKKYRDGMRLVNGKWITKEKEAEICRDFRHAWAIRTDHFLIKTNHSREQALALGRALEDFYEIFFQTFAGFFQSPEQLKRLFDGAGSEAKAGAKPYVIHYYRSKQEYVDRLKHRFPQIAVTNGIYLFPEPGQKPDLTEDHIVHAFHDNAENNEATLFHEATHQLFFESQPRDRWIGDKAHFWIIEGIACYMESFRRDNEGVSLGDPKYVRFTDARRNLLAEDSYYLPLKEFTSLGMRDFQHHPQLVKNYTQASGLAHFFMHYDGGRYREALVEQLSQLYSANKSRRDKTPGLDELTGVPASELDREYAEFCREVEQEVAEAEAAQSKSARQSPKRP